MIRLTLAGLALTFCLAGYVHLDRLTCHRAVTYAPWIKCLTVTNF
jgi:hypothetical protein